MNDPKPRNRKLAAPEVSKPVRSAGKQRIELSTPWHIDGQHRLFGYSEDTARAFVEERTRLHAMFIREEAKTKRLALLISALLALGGVVILIFAPEAKQILANWIGATLFVSAGGAAGYKRLWWKSRGVQFGGARGD